MAILEAESSSYAEDAVEPPLGCEERTRPTGSSGSLCHATRARGFRFEHSWREEACLKERKSKRKTNIKKHIVPPALVKSHVYHFSRGTFYLDFRLNTEEPRLVRVNLRLA